MEGRAGRRRRDRDSCQQVALTRHLGRNWRRCVGRLRVVHIPLVFSPLFAAAFNYDYNALDGGERSAISKGYDNLA